MSKTKAQLEEENDALRALIAAIGEALPPLPADAEKMNLFNIECASRLSMAATYAAGVAGCREDWLAPYAQSQTAELRTRWARPLHYEPERPDFSEDATAIVATAIETGMPVIVEDDACGRRPTPTSALRCDLPASHKEPHETTTDSAVIRWNSPVTGEDLFDTIAAVNLDHAS